MGVAVFTAAAALTAKTVLHSHTASAAARPGGQAQHTTWHTRDVDVLQVKEGDCLPRGLTRRIIVRNVTVGSCHQPHREEVYAVFDLEPGHYHGQQSVDRRSDADCKKRFKTYVGIAYGVSEMHYEAVTPWATTLSARNRQVECVLVDIHRDTATLRGARR